MIKRDLHKAAILIVDDNPVNIQVLANILARENYRIAAAADGRQALSRIKESKPDLILLDVAMPIVDGFEVCERLKESDETSGIPIIFLTARTEEEDIVKGFNLGAVDYVTKPFNSTELLARVKTHLTIKRQQDLIVEKNAEQRELLHILCHDLANPFASIVSVLDSIDNMDKLDHFKPHMLSAAHNGLEVIELVRKLRKLEDQSEVIQLEPYPLRPMLEESCNIVRPKLEEKDLAFTVDAKPGIRVNVEPASFINSVFNNLLTNAIKFSHPKSEIMISAKQENGKVEIVVKDFGIGMSEKLINGLFNVHQIHSRKGTAGEIGTGFGMPLVKKFITAYGGSIKVDSKEESESPKDHGTEIILTLNAG